MKSFTAFFHYLTWFKLCACNYFAFVCLTVSFAQSKLNFIFFFFFRFENIFPVYASANTCTQLEKKFIVLFSFFRWLFFSFDMCVCVDHVAVYIVLPWFFFWLDFQLRVRKNIASWLAELLYTFCHEYIWPSAQMLCVWCCRRPQRNGALPNMRSSYHW